jgi:tRNA (uracil-5-)-methyltransferase TRM9
MNPETRARLNALNREFYRTRAPEFSATRDHPWPGWERVVERVRGSRADAAEEPLGVLDVGCGNGRFGEFLASAWEGRIEYRGLDASSELLEVARERTQALETLRARLECVDLLDDPQHERGSALPDERFALVVAFGLLHHVPGSAQRLALVGALAERVAPEGWLAVSAWQFGRSERLLRRIIPWAEYATDDPIDPEQLEPGDHLLPFGDRDAAPRYCHHCDAEELDTLARAPGPAEKWRLERFDADGRSGDLNHYLVWQRQR